MAVINVSLRLYDQVEESGLNFFFLGYEREEGKEKKGGEKGEKKKRMLGYYGRVFIVKKRKEKRDKT